MVQALRSSAMASVVLLVLGVVQEGTTDQLLRNPDFEQTAGDKPDFWTRDGTAASVEGGRSGKAISLGKGGRVYQCFALEPGFQYQGSVWAKGSGKLTLAYYEYKDGPGQGYTGGVSSGAIALSQQWTEYFLAYSQGPSEKNLKGLCFALSSDSEGEESNAIVDEVVLDRTPLARDPKNLLLNPGFSDCGPGGLPLNWRGEKRRLKVETGPAGMRVVRVAAALFSEDYQPSRDSRDWWSWSRWGEQHGSGWPPLPRPLGGAYTPLFESDPVPVEPGRRYDVTLLLRHLEVWGEFIAVRWFDENRKPAEEFEERIGYYHISEGNSSDWAKYVGRVTSPQAARYASIVVGCKLSSGAVWVGQPSLAKGLGGPNRHEPRSEWQPADLRQSVPKAEATPQKLMKSGKPPKLGVVVVEGAVRIGFENGVGVTMPLQDGKLLGITEVSCRGRLLRNPVAPPLAPVVETTPPRNYTECVFEGHEWTKTGLVIHSTLRTGSGQADKLDWMLSPVSQSLAGRAYFGLRYGYRFRSSEVRVRRIMDRATWEVGGTPLGLRVSGDLFPLGTSSTFCLTTAYRFVESDSFDYQTSRNGTLVGYFDHYHTSLFARGATPDFLILQDTFLFPEVPDASTTMKSVFYCPQPGGSDDWARIRDALHERYRKQLGAPPERPLEPAAMIIGYGGLRGIGDLRPEDPNIKQVDYYHWVTDKAVPRLAELGFKRVMLVLPRAPWNWPAKDINDLCPEYAEPFKALCDAAHERGMKVLAWYGSVQNLEGAAMWKEHPEFMLMGPNGQRARTYYSPWGWPGKLEAGFGTYTLDRLRSIRDRTGLDGLWLDSYSSATHLMETADFGDAVRQADGLLPWQGAIEKMGYYTYCEGDPHCIGYPSTSGWEQPEDGSRFRPESYYKRGLYLQQPWGKSNLPHDLSAMGRFLSDSGQRFYYRLLANRCCPILDMGHFGTDTAAMEVISRANRDFNAVSEVMETRHLLGGNGVEWMSPKGRAVFAFEDLGYDVPKALKRVTDVTTGRATAVPRSRRVRLVKYHTYRLEPAREGGSR